MIAIDSSAILAVVFQETDADDFMYAMLRNESVVTAPILVEMRTVLTRRNLAGGSALIAGIFDRTDTKVIAFTPDMADLASTIFARYGKGRHPAKLNFGDCMSYAFARSLGVPLLYKGNDFVQTDIRSALR